MKTLVTGSSGLVGKAFVESCSEKHTNPIKMVRSEPKLSGDSSTHLWKPLEVVKDLPKADAVVHLAGEGILGLWSQAKKERMTESRVESTKNLCKSLIESGSIPKVFVCASGIGIYGSRGDEILTEQSSLEDNLYLSKLAKDWEDACSEIKAAGTRVVNLRISVVLSPMGGALQKMLPAFRLGLGGPLGSGNQWMSWISLEDLVKVIHFSIENESLEGPINVCSPGTVDNNTFTKALGSKLGRPTFFRVPEFVLKTVAGEMARNTFLISNRAEPRVLTESGFEFNHPTLEDYFNTNSL